MQIRCATWQQVEAFYLRKLRRGNLLSVKVGFAVVAGQVITVGLELPTQLVVALDGVVRRVAPMEQDRRLWIEIELVGDVAESIARLRYLVETNRDSDVAIELPPSEVQLTADEPPPPELVFAGVELQASAPEAERVAFAELSAQLRRMRQLSVHALLGVSAEATPAEIRTSWRRLIARFHPDVLARFRSSAVIHIGEEIVILINRAYDRLRQTLVTQGKAAAFGSALVAPRGWLVGFEDVTTGEPLAPRHRTASGRYATNPGVPGEGPVLGGEGGDSFEVRARNLLRAGDVDDARELLAMALVVYPRSRSLRSLYYIASALVAARMGQQVLATSQLETAVAHDESCAEAQSLLVALQRGVGLTPTFLATIFGGPT